MIPPTFSHIPDSANVSDTLSESAPRISESSYFAAAVPKIPAENRSQPMPLPLQTSSVFT